ncbi:signal peptide peptidase SppA [Notoacmeibacter sp. MSK16QG-6]|uniref:signal peptide peptidase SppA n=1 Tax=Notoacmeibacter sp. MSK16QG-6 TaxID=2957982 RepID=UPI0020A1F580|nr:signal peptide peptidase SppA [Notoacmeibacter sp. MSK16QG-6]MCP1198893.1 signal peptide peptidase SppA [Notoacmeibacter sp. MSK16QG-6]
MSATDAEEIVARRQQRRKLGRWRIAAIVFALIAVGAVIWRAGLPGDEMSLASQIAKVKIEGAITEDTDLLDRLDRIASTDSVKGVVLVIDSPGGTSVGGEAIHDAIRKIAIKKPVVAQVGTLAASAGYMIAAAADHIVARQSSIVGSIGVLVQYPNVERGLDMIGIEMDAVKSSPLKAEPSPFNPTTQAEREVLQKVVDDIYEWFVALVAERRPLSLGETRTLADGSVFSGRQALENKLVDALGGEDAAVEWLESKGIAKDLAIVEWKPKAEYRIFGIPVGSTGGSTADLLDRLPLPLIGQWLKQKLMLDGVMALWQPSAAGR